MAQYRKTSFERSDKRKKVGEKKKNGPQFSCINTVLKKPSFGRDDEKVFGEKVIMDGEWSSIHLRTLWPHMHSV